MKKTLYYSIALTGFILVNIFANLLFAQNQIKSKNNIVLEWVSELKGDFSFKDRWNYSEWIFTNEFGQLVCDGLCPDEISGMRDEEGRIYPDMMDQYYQLIDTTHYFYSIHIDSWELSPLWYINVEQKGKDTLVCNTELGVSTYNSLHITITDQECTSHVKLFSPMSGGDHIYPCIDGHLKIDKKLRKKGILKATFHLNFKDESQPKGFFTWKGQIYETIENPDPKI